MRTYSIKELENFSGTKAHTIRIWEQRYSLLEPKRTKTGIRYYSDEDLKKILGTSVLLKSGFKISKIAQLNKEEFRDALDKIESSSNEIDENLKYEKTINILLSAGLEFNEYLFINEFEKVRKLVNIDELFIKVIYPLLMKSGIMWGKDDMSPAQEHFISNILRQKIITEINSLTISEKNSNKIVLFLPENETHEIGLLFANYLLKSAGIETIYLGQQVPVTNLITMINEYNIERAIGFVFYSPGIDKLTKMVELISENCTKTKFYWGGALNTLKELSMPKNQFIISSIDDFISIFINSKK